MIKRIANLFQHKEILKQLVIKHLKAKYAAPALGILWAVINPFLLILVISFIFTEIIKVNTKNFYLFVISGMLPWSFFSNSLQEAATSIVDHAHLLKQFFLPREFIPVTSVLTNFIIFLFGLLIALPFFIFFNPSLISGLPMLILTLLLHLVFTIGIALALSSLYVYFRDIGQFLGVFLLFWLWLTPVFYSMDMVPVKYRMLFSINPLTPYINLYRSVLFDKSLFKPSFVLLSFFSSFISICLGYIMFIKKEANFLKQI